MGASSPVRASGRPDGNEGCVSAVTRRIGNDVPRKAVAPARCFGIEGHVGNRMHDFETLGRTDGRASGKRCGQKVRGRRSCWCPRFVSAGLGAGGARFRSGLERSADGFGQFAQPAGSVGESPESERSPREQRANQSRQRGGRATDSWRGKPLRWGRLLESGLISVDHAGRKRANRERGRTYGERASNGSVTVSTWSGGESFGGYSACGKCRDSGGNVVPRHATRRTPWSVVGCNKPTLSSADETVEVVRNGMDGTAWRGWQPLHQIFGSGSGTQRLASMEGRSLKKP